MLACCDSCDNMKANGCASLIVEYDDLLLLRIINYLLLRWQMMVQLKVSY